jgi:hypothetical protein
LYEKKDFDSIQYYIQLRWQPEPVDPDLNSTWPMHNDLRIYVARYHFLDYKNPGGSPFDGNAATIDIIIGHVGEYRH